MPHLKHFNHHSHTTFLTSSEPKFQEAPHDVETYEGLPITVPCSLTKLTPSPSPPSPTPDNGDSDDSFAVWRKEGQPLYQSDDITITTNGSLVIERSKVRDSAEYECVAVSEEGVLTATITVLVHPRPG